MADSSRAYRLSPRAEADLEKIWLYTFRNWSADQADRYHKEIVAAFEALAAGTKTGRRVDVREGYHKYAVGAHFIFYRQSEASLVIIRVLHQRMDVEAHLRD